MPIAPVVLVCLDRSPSFEQSAREEVVARLVADVATLSRAVPHDAVEVVVFQIGSGETRSGGPDDKEVGVILRGVTHEPEPTASLDEQDRWDEAQVQEIEAANAFEAAMAGFVATDAAATPNTDLSQCLGRAAAYTPGAAGPRTLIVVSDLMNTAGNPLPDLTAAPIDTIVTVSACAAEGPACDAGAAAYEAWLEQQGKRLDYRTRAQVGRELLIDRG